jgi:vacuolar-type H+-ATPase subunit B/Vma2
MSVNVFERNGYECKYVEIFTHRFGSTGAPDRRTMFINNNNNNNLVNLFKCLTKAKMQLQESTEERKMH